MTHAFNITHVCYWIIKDSKAFSPFQKLAMIVSLIGHDLDHPGLGASYFTKSAHPILGAVSGKGSILEHYHLAVLHSILDET